MDTADQELQEDLLAFIRSAENPSAASIIEAYVRSHQGIDSGAVRLAMMKLLDSGIITVGSGWRLQIRRT